MLVQELIAPLPSMKMPCVAFVTTVNARTQMPSYFVTCATLPSIKNAMEFLIYRRDNGYVEDACNLPPGVWIVFYVPIKGEPSNKLTMDGGLMLYVLSGFQKFVLQTRSF